MTLSGDDSDPETGVPAIGVVIPHLNQEDFLRRCLASLRAQTGAVPDFEIIVVDNGSRRMPAEVCAEFDARLIAEPTPGPGPARNKGAALTRAPLLAFIDADCTADPGWLAAVARRFGDPEAQILGGDVRIARVDPDNLTALEAYESVFAFRMKEYIEKQGFTGTGNLAMRRETLTAVGPFGGLHIAEDKDWGERSGKLGYRIIYAAEMVVFHPARTSMAELYKKWDRHIGHLFEPYAASLWGRLRWAALALAVALSPLGEIPRILRSDRIKGIRERWLAFRALVTIRLYRARKMLPLSFGADPRKLSGVWNRE